MSVTASDIMTRDVVCVKATASLQELLEIVSAQHVSGVPVLDEESKLVGIVSKTDLVTYGLERELSAILGQETVNTSHVDLPDFNNLLGSEPAKESVSQLMTSSVITAAPSTEVKALVRIMLENKIHRVVITDNERVVGIVSSMDLLRLLDK